MATGSSASSSPSPEPAASTRRKKDPPERKIGPFPNGVGVCIWKNEATTEQGPRTFRTITINPRRYFDRESQQWKDAPSFNPSDLPSLIYALQLAASFCYEQNPPDHDGGEGTEETPF